MSCSWPMHIRPCPECGAERSTAQNAVPPIRPLKGVLVADGAAPASDAGAAGEAADVMARPMVHPKAGALVELTTKYVALDEENERLREIVRELREELEKAEVRLEKVHE